MPSYLSHSEEETLAWAESYAKTLKKGDVVLLDGEMGAGKTVLAKGIARGLGIKSEVCSPTYAYVNTYVTADGSSLFHFDCYRLPSAEYAERMGLADCFGLGICLVEWSEKIAPLLPEDTKRITLTKRGEHLREIGF